MERNLVETEDGSHTLFVPALDEHYHSRHGAVQESRHVFLKMGWENAKLGKEALRILEIGLGTGLNALLTAIEAERSGIEVDYVAVEAYPIQPEEYTLMNYPDLVGEEGAAKLFEQIHSTNWGTPRTISPNFRIQKLHEKIEAFDLHQGVDLIYFDAFAPEKQPELWTADIFDKMYRLMNVGGILTTYCAKGVVRRTMQAAGFEVERVPGPPGKREMLIARKK